MAEQKDMLNAREICQALDMSCRALTRLAKEKMIPGLVRVGRRLKMHAEVREAYRGGEKIIEKPVITRLRRYPV